MASSIKEPKTWTIPSYSWGISADEAADTLIRAEEIKANKELLKAARANLKSKKKAISKLT